MISRDPLLDIKNRMENYNPATEPLSLKELYDLALIYSRSKKELEEAEKNSGFETAFKIVAVPAIIVALPFLAVKKIVNWILD